jgi:hypothetical protein
MASMIRTSRGIFSEAVQTGVDIIDTGFQIPDFRLQDAGRSQSGIRNLKSVITCKEDICLMLLK